MKRHWNQLHRQPTRWSLVQTWPAIQTRREKSTRIAPRPTAWPRRIAIARNNCCQPLARPHPSKMAIKLDAKTSKCLNKMLLSGGGPACWTSKSTAVRLRRYRSRPTSCQGGIFRFQGRSRSGKVVYLLATTNAIPKMDNLFLITRPSGMRAETAFFSS